MSQCHLRTIKPAYNIHNACSVPLAYHNATCVLSTCLQWFSVPGMKLNIPFFKVNFFSFSHSHPYQLRKKNPRLPHPIPDHTSCLVPTNPRRSKKTGTLSPIPGPPSRDPIKTCQQSVIPKLMERTESAQKPAN
jgi:hypothetical protein